MTVTVNDQPVTLYPDGSFSSVVTLASGTNTITTVVTNDDATTTTDTRTIFYNAASPALGIAAPPDNSIVNHQPYPNSDLEQYGFSLKPAAVNCSGVNKQRHSECTCMTGSTTPWI